MSCPSAEQRPSRRTVLTDLGRWAAALAGTALLHPLLAFTGFTVKAKPRQMRIPAPLPRSGVHAERDFLLFAAPGQGTAWAVSRICTHLGCRVNFLEDRQLIECPCHQSRFTPKGERLAGPAKRDLPCFAVTAEKDAAGAVTGYVVTF